MQNGRNPETRAQLVRFAFPQSQKIFCDHCRLTRIDHTGPFWISRDGAKQFCGRVCRNLYEERKSGFRILAAGFQRPAMAALALLFGLLTYAAVPQDATAQDATAHDGHLLYHADFYQHWKQPGSGHSCCNAKVTNGLTTRGDCFPTQAEMRKGRWWAKTDSNKWVPIPDDKILKERNPDPEAAHLCYDSRVLCFVPPNTGF